ncbi:hypothetical protein T484DRAFT_1798105 [Baffinella frigidus]|nr:hypothetical protein T484DRAFT_1798105 [Cryptophyta sp. CCMP2293]
MTKWIWTVASFNGIAGVYARGWGSAVKVEGCTISNNSWQGATCAHGGYVEVHNSWVEKNGMAGVCAFGEGSRLQVANADISLNQLGVAVELGGRGNVVRSRLVSNEEAGAFTSDQGSYISLETCQIEENLIGVVAEEEGEVFLEGCILRHNTFKQYSQLGQRPKVPS